MTRAVANLLEEFSHLSPQEQVEVADMIVERMVPPTSSPVFEAQMGEVRRRISEVESGRDVLVPGDEALAKVRRLIPNSR